MAVQPSESLDCQMVGFRFSSAYISIMSQRRAMSKSRARSSAGAPEEDAPVFEASVAMRAAFADDSDDADENGAGMTAARSAPTDVQPSAAAIEDSVDRQTLRRSSGADLTRPSWWCCAAPDLT